MDTARRQPALVQILRNRRGVRTGQPEEQHGRALWCTIYSVTATAKPL
ncbi:hypothetical protein JOE48_002891 [Methylobacterium sp. PvR107]|nr:hypothetical protein [Methylobacterium sp. PvR107]